MSKAVPPSVFFGKRVTRGLSKIAEKEPSNSVGLNASSSEAENLSIAGRSNSRQLRSTRSAVKQISSAKTCSAVKSPSKKIIKGGKQNTNTAKQAEQAVHAKTTTRNLSTSPVKINEKSSTTSAPRKPVYKQSVKPAEYCKEISDEYEFQADTPEDGATKPKRKKKRACAKPKVQTLWGLTVKTESKKKTKQCKPGDIAEHENVKQVCANKPVTRSVKETVTMAKKPGILQERSGEGKKDQKEQDVENAVKPRKDLTDASSKINPNLGKSMPLVTPSKMFTVPQTNSTPIQPSGSSPSMGSRMNSMRLVLSPIQVHQSLLTRNKEGKVQGNKSTSQTNASIASRSSIISSKSFENIVRDKENSSVGSCTASKQLRLSTSLASIKEHRVQGSSTPRDKGNLPDHLDDTIASENMSCFPDSDVFNPPPDLFQEIPKNAKFSMPARLLGAVGSRNTGSLAQIPPRTSKVTVRREPLPTVQQEESPQKSSRQVVADLTIDNCFGFDDDSGEVCKSVSAKSFRPTFPKRQVPPCQNTNVLPIEKINEMLLSSIPEKRVELSKDITEVASSSREDITSDTDMTSQQNCQSQSSPSSSTTSSDSEDDLPRRHHEVSIPLFEDVFKDDIYKSPFSQPPRRSYDRVKRVKRTKFQDDSADENEEEAEEGKTANKKKAGKKSKKMVQTSLYHQWAKNISSHFAEVEEMDLAVE